MNLVALGLAGFALSFLLTLAAKRIAPRLGVVAHPANDRWHRSTVPLLGGVAVALPVVAALVLLPGPTTERAVLLAGPSLMLLVGLADDVRPLSPRWKLLPQVALAMAVAASGVQLRLTGEPLANAALTVLWIVGVTNAFNLLDNMDGLAAGIAAITVGFRLAFFALDGNLEAGGTAAVFVGAALGFLAHNFPPASIFMGDAGSFFTGSFVAILCLTGGYPYSRHVVSVLLIPALIVLVPILDTSFVTLTRTLAGRPIYMGGRDHLSHRLVALGLKEREAVAALYALAAASGLAAIATYRLGIWTGLAFLGVLAATTIRYGARLARTGRARSEQVPDAPTAEPAPSGPARPDLSAPGSMHAE